MSDFLSSTNPCNVNLVTPKQFICLIIYCSVKKSCTFTLLVVLWLCLCVLCSQSVQDSITEQSNNVTPVDGLPVTTMKGKQLPKGIYLTVNDFIAAFDDPLNKKIKRLEMQIFEYKQQVSIIIDNIYIMNHQEWFILK